MERKWNISSRCCFNNWRQRASRRPAAPPPPSVVAQPEEADEEEETGHRRPLQLKRKDDGARSCFRFFRFCFFDVHGRVGGGPRGRGEEEWMKLNKWNKNRSMQRCRGEFFFGHWMKRASSASPAPSAAASSSFSASSGWAWSISVPLICIFRCARDDFFYGGCRPLKRRRRRRHLPPSLPSSGLSASASALLIWISSKLPLIFDYLFSFFNVSWWDWPTRKWVIWWRLWTSGRLICIFGVYGTCFRWIWQPSGWKGPNAEVVVLLVPLFLTSGQLICISELKIRNWLQSVERIGRPEQRQGGNAEVAPSGDISTSAFGIDALPHSASDISGVSYSKIGRKRSGNAPSADIRLTSGLPNMQMNHFKLKIKSKFQ